MTDTEDSLGDVLDAGVHDFHAWSELLRRPVGLVLAPAASTHPGGRRGAM
ncbi:hypothetical protein [Streptomyces nanshensis]|nr:hypothetical protein [Streptomyces nanshensis]